ncbi:MAG: flagellar hook-associated family protein [Hyphomicrobium sp.]
MSYPAHISTAALSQQTTSAIARLQKKLVAAQTELTTGRHADVGLELGAKTGLSVALRQDHVQLSAVVESNSLVATRLSATQASLQNISGIAQNYLAVLVRAQATTSAAETIVVEAQAGLSSLFEGLDVSVDGQYLFAGINSDVRPVENYFGTPAPASRNAVAAAFLSAFGVAQSSPAAQAITPAQMQTFLNTTLPPEFADPNWMNNWSEASDKNIRSRIGRQELVETSTNANELAFRDLTAGLVMVADLGFANLNDSARQVILDKAIGLVGKAVSGIGDIQSQLGVTQERLKSSTDVLNIQIRQVTVALGNIENVDEAEVATRITTLMTHLESAYSITRRIHELSIMDYLT